MKNRVITFLCITIGWALLVGFSPDLNLTIDGLFKHGFTRAEVDKRNDGTINEIQYFVFNESGKLERIDFDADNDGSIDSGDDVSHFYYNAAGKLDREECDEGNDGTIDSIDKYIYDGSCHIVRIETWVNGAIDSVIYCYYSSDLLVRDEEDWGNDGSIDQSSYYAYNASSDLETEQADSGNNGSIDKTYHYYYDSAGKLVRLEVDDSYNGVGIDSSENWVYKPVCECDINRDGRCDMRDWLLFGKQWGSTDCFSLTNQCGIQCRCNLNFDGRCDMRDWLLFGKSWGRTNCPQ